MPENINLIIQIIAASGVIVSVVYLGIQIHQQNNITRAGGRVNLHMELPLHVT